MLWKFYNLIERFVVVIIASTNKLFIQMPNKTTAGRGIIKRNIRQYGRKGQIQAWWGLMHIWFWGGILLNKKSITLCLQNYVQKWIFLNGKTNHNKWQEAWRYRSCSNKLRQFVRSAHRELLLEYSLAATSHLEPSAASSHSSAST